MPSGIYKGNKGKLLTKETKEKMKLNNAHYWLGKRRSRDFRKKMSKLHKGDKSHFWKGGISRDLYSVNWTGTLRRSIRERDNYICRLCSQYGDCVHHIDYNKKNCCPENLITLCVSCNSKVNKNRKYWIKYFYEKFDR